MNTRRAALAALSVVALAGWLPVTARAQTTPPPARIDPEVAARDAALRRLAGRLHLPLVDAAVNVFSRQLRRTLPAYFVASIGQQVNLGPGWRAGNPTFDDATRRVDAALGVEEARNGPLVRLESGDLLYAVNIPWTRDDIGFVDGTLDTDIGHEAERALDAKAAQQTIATLRSRVAIGPEGEDVKRGFADVDDRAQSQFGDAMLMLLALKAADPPRAQRLQRLIEAVSVAPSNAIGQRIVDRLSARLLNAAMAQVPDILAGLATGRLR